MTTPSTDACAAGTRRRAKRSLRVEHLTKKFGGVTAVDDVSFAVAPGEALAIIGPNGAGKSSLLKMLTGSYRPDAGAIHLGGTAVHQLSAQAVARGGVGLAHQIPRPFGGLTVRENVAIGAMARQRVGRRARAESVEAILRTCALAGKADVPAAALRLLDLKRLELARALSIDPDLLLLDEVAAGLSGRDLADVVELIRAVSAEGRSVVLVEHVEGVVASLVDRVLVLDWGKVIAEGTPAQVSADPHVRNVYLGRQEDERVRATPTVGSHRAVLLEVDSVTARYGDITALREVSLTVHEGEIVAVLGANGAGKSTLAGIVSGLLRPQSGSVRFLGRDITNDPAFSRNRAGVAHCPEGRKVFADLTVHENLLLGARPRSRRGMLQALLDEVHSTFPMLADLTSHTAGTLSGGQQQMLAIGRALMSRPALLLCDEISLGLAPVAIDALYDALIEVRRRGVAIVLVEQNVRRSLSVADRVSVLERGRVTYSGDPQPLTDEAALNEFYFGSTSSLSLQSH